MSRVFVLSFNEHISVDQRIYLEAKTLASNGHDITICAVDDSTPLKGDFLGVSVKRIGGLPKLADRSISPIRYYATLAFCALIILLRIVAGRPDVIHCHDSGLLPIAFWAAKLCRAKAVYDSHELPIELDVLAKRGEKSKILRGILSEGFCVHRINAVITVNDSIAEEIMRGYKIAKPIILMNCQEYVHLPRGDRIRKELKLDADQRIVLFQGSFSADRGLTELIESALYLDRAVIVLIGWGVMKEGLIQQVRHMGLARKVLFIDRVPYEELLSYTASADVGIVPMQKITMNNYYSSAIKVFEYIMAGIPVVGSDFPEFRRILLGDEVGKVCDEKDPKSIARVINSVLNDPEGYREMAQNALLVARTKYNWEVQSKRLVELYRRL